MKLSDLIKILKSIPNEDDKINVFVDTGDYFANIKEVQVNTEPYVFEDSFVFKMSKPIEVILK